MTAVALRVPGAIVQAYTKRSPVKMKAPATEGVMSGQFSGLVDKWMDSFPPKAGASVTLCGERESERGRRMTAVIGTGRVSHL